MAIFKCKMCGGQLEIENGATVCECEYCGTQQTLPKTDNEQNLNMFNRANHFRQQCEFDKAAEIYERMTPQSDDAELFWSIVLCRYGIEYVDDPKTGRKIPTCHRTQYKPILEDADYLEALNRADSVQRSIYISEAEYIDSVQKGILEISNKEEPFDVFICYKESDESGKRTQDSVIAQDLYYQLEQEGFKVFFSRITLESKLGAEYEPYIFAALNSAKVMVVVGTKAEYFNAVWVKNEWSRFLMLMQEDKSKTMIPAYKDMDPYDLPDALSMFQAQDMSKLGFMQDLIRGINKLTRNDEPVKKSFAAAESESAAGGGSTASLLKRAALFLDDGDWNSAVEYCNKVLDLDPECAKAYFYMILAELKIHDENIAGSVFGSETEDFYYEHGKYKNGIGELKYYKKAYRYADPEFKKKLEYYQKQSVYGVANEQFCGATTAEEYQKAKDAFGHEEIRGFKDVEQKIAECDREIEKCKEKDRQLAYNRAEEALKKAFNSVEFAAAAELFKALGDYRDSEEKVKECENGALEYDYNRAAETLRKAKAPDVFTEAERLFKKLGDYKDSKEQARECVKRLKSHQFSTLCARLDAIVIEKGKVGKNEYAAEKLQGLKKDFEESKYEGYREKIAECDRKIALAIKLSKKARRKKKAILSLIAAAIVLSIATPTVILPSVKYMIAVKLMGDGNYNEAITRFSEIKDFSDSENKILEAKYNLAIESMEEERYSEAITWFSEIKDFSDSENKIMEAKYNLALESMEEERYSEAFSLLSDLNNYKDSENKKIEALAVIKENIISNVVSAARSYTAGLKSDGTVVAVGDNGDGQCDIDDWKDIVAISAGYSHMVGLKSDGTIVAVGSNDSNQCNVDGWSDIVAVSAGGFHTVGLESDGSVVADGNNDYGRCNVDDWKDIVAVSAGHIHTVGLRSDGTVVAVGCNDSNQCNVDGWKDIIAVSAGGFHTVGLESDGTVVATGINSYGQRNVGDWKGIVAIAAGKNHTVGLKADGTVVAVGENVYHQCDVDDWTDIVAVAAGETHTVGLKADGTVVAVGKSNNGQCNVDDWSGIKTE